MKIKPPENNIPIDTNTISTIATIFKKVSASLLYEPTKVPIIVGIPTERIITQLEKSFVLSIFSNIFP
jgi:hypothetical protein